MRLYNTLTRRKEEFKPLKKGHVSMYNCGPTVYDFAHIGNLRAFVFADILRRVLEYNGYEVKQVMNITDVDDKTIRKAQEEHIPLSELTKRYEGAFLRNIEALNIKSPHVLSRATEHIPEMVLLIEKLIDKGIAYRGDDGSVYFDISKDPNYGELAELGKIDLKEGARVSRDEYTKDEARDFALWKSWTHGDGDIFWETSLGKGRPGWHIECSAMSVKYLGESFDIHTGGVDLMFPHHTNEIAQSEAATGKQFVRYWLHTEFVTVNGKKMAKSEGTFITLDVLVKKGYSPLAYRYWLLSAHYRSPVNFSWDALEGAENALKKLGEHMQELPETEVMPDEQYKNDFASAIGDNLNTPRALALLWQLIKDKKVSPDAKRSTVRDFDRVLGLRLADVKKEPIPPEISKMAEEREKTRADGDFKKADAIREKIKKQGFAVEDTSKGPKITRQ